jgi:tetratricopeptide (TPR) repeat protein
VSDASAKTPLLDALYQEYLTNETSARFVAEVSKHYTLGTLERLATAGSRTTRRAAVLAIGFLGSFESNDVMGRALRDADRVVRLLAENSIRELWYRDGSESQQQLLQTVIRLNNSRRFDQAALDATRLIQEADGFAEAWNQRAIARYQLERYADSLRDCRRAIELNPYHFPAAVGMGHCHLELSDAVAALECFRLALALNPDMENVRAQVGYLQRTLEGR